MIGKRIVAAGCMTVLAVGACGSKENNGDEGAAMLGSFKAFVAKELPGTKKGDAQATMSCTWATTDVIKTNSTASPYQGLVKGQGSMVMNGMETQQHVFELKFTKEGDGWKCVDVESIARNTDGRVAEPCSVAKALCSGK